MFGLLGAFKPLVLSLVVVGLFPFLEINSYLSKKKKKKNRGATVLLSGEETTPPCLVPVRSKVGGPRVSSSLCRGLVELDFPPL